MGPFYWRFWLSLSPLGPMGARTVAITRMAVLMAAAGLPVRRPRPIQIHDPPPQKIFTRSILTCPTPAAGRITTISIKLPSRRQTRRRLTAKSIGTVPKPGRPTILTVFKPIIISSSSKISAHTRRRIRKSPPRFIIIPIRPAMCVKGSKRSA